MEAREHPTPLILTRMDALPLLLAVGILAYTALGAEPPAWVAVGVPLFGLSALLLRHRPRWRDAALALAVILLGLSAALWQTARVDSPRIPERWKPWEVTGRVVTASPDEGKAKLLVEVERINGLAAEEMPRRVRISVRGKRVLPRAGDRVRFRAILYAPSPPLIPGGFDFAHYFYYRGIGAVGYALPPVEVLETSEAGGLHARFSRLRFAVQEWLLAHLSQPASGIAVALLTGDRTAIDEKTAEAFRTSSLAHILSISGMHMSIVCGMMFLFLRSLLSLIPPVALRFNVKKLSAVVALLLGGAYLLLADFPVPAVRAYVMVAFFFAGVLLDREALTLRSLVWAASLLLLAQPSSLMEPGFQLSFAATLALIVAYRRFAASRYGRHWEERSLSRRVAVYFGGIILSSLVASAATAPFIAYHFNQFSPYGILANLLALPLLSFVVMPSLLLALLLWAIGGEELALPVARWGLEQMVEVARWVESIPGASWYIPPIAPEALPVIVAGMLFFMLSLHYWRWAGVAAVLLGLATAGAYIPPDILLSDDGKQLAVRVQAKDWVLVRGKSNRNFVVEQWRQRLGVEMQTYKKWRGKSPDEQVLSCMAEACTWQAFDFPLHGRVLVRWAGGTIRWPDLDRKGAHAVWLKEGEKPRVVSACRETFRPWEGCARGRLLRKPAR